MIDYGNALRDLAASNVFPGDLLLKNFGVTSHRRVIFYDYDELCLLSECVFRDLPQPSCEEEETSGEPWFHCGPHDVFPEQWLPFLSIPDALREVFLEHHADLLTAAWWRRQQAAVAATLDATVVATQANPLESTAQRERLPAALAG
jgi:isocitrate dehydrogenase kinase/phosphatase